MHVYVIQYCMLQYLPIHYYTIKYSILYYDNMYNIVKWYDILPRHDIVSYYMKVYQIKDADFKFLAENLH